MATVHNRVRSAFRGAVLATFALTLAGDAALAAGPIDWRAVPAVLTGWLLADAASGIVHMYMDYRPCRPGVGLGALFCYAGSRESAAYLALREAAMARLGPLERLVFDFKNHHPRPDALGRRTLLTLVWTTVAFGTLPAALLLGLVAVVVPVPAWLMAGFAALLVGGTFAQYFHAALHRAQVPLPVRLLRRCGLLMTPAAHARHHATLRRDFATNCGWANPLLNPVFTALHRRGIVRDAGLEPN